MTLTFWVILGGVLWVLAAVALAIVLARVIRSRDKQKPKPN